MTPEAAHAPEPAPAGMGAFARIAGVFFEPGKTFQDIARRPAFLAPLLLIMAGTVVFSVVFGQHVGYEHMLRQQMETGRQYAQMSAEQRDQALAMQLRFAPIFGYLSAIFVPLGYLIISAVLLGTTAMMSAGLKFKQVFAVVCFSGLPNLIFSLLAVVVMFLKNPADFDIRNPLAFNPAALMDPQTSSKFVYSLATSIDLFSFWMIFLLATGFKAAAGKKLSFGGALFAVLLPWGVYVLGKSALAGVFS